MRVSAARYTFRAGGCEMAVCCCYPKTTVMLEDHWPPRSTAFRKLLRRSALRRSSWRKAVVAVVLLTAVHAALLVWGAARHSPVWDEPGHLVAGISHWTFGRFDLYRVNPPLVRVISSLPVVLCSPSMSWRGYRDSVDTRPERSLRRTFVALNTTRLFHLHTVSRWTCVPLIMLGAYACYRWGLELYGEGAGLLAMTLWCCSPAILAYGQLITPDAAAAALGASAGYCFWRWLRREDRTEALAAGCTLGAAQLAKTSWIVLFGVWPLLWLLWCVGRPRRAATEAVWRGPAQFVLLLVIALVALNLGYGFQGSFRKLADYSFVSGLFGGRSANVDGGHRPRNRFEASWVGQLRVPLPSDYLMGIDLQKSDFEGKMWSYLRGEWRLGGWWYY
ncbi:MAG TPA: phospholipid carrier-dependent glycosyltransferase, partial [Planctomycetaceae bacterium]|nr:phospholipid carrier-dependent glycosyltransferase [Planctomycetaceae bacterium]